MALFLNVAAAQSIPLPPERIETTTQIPPVGTPESIKPRSYRVTKPAQLPPRGRALPRIDVPTVAPTTTDLPIVELQPEKKPAAKKDEDDDDPLKFNDDDPLDAEIPLSITRKELPATRAEIFNMEEDAELIRRIRKELAREEYERGTEREKKDTSPNLKPDQFVPPEIAMAGDNLTYVPKTVNYPPQTQFIYPSYIVHRPLYFEEKNSERYGWELGIAQPAISALYFYKDVLFWPAHLASNVRERYDTNRGKCLPGSPVPYYLYPPEISLLGLGAEASAVIATAAFIVP